ncbi:MAG: Lrp/AsnC ligand binding domain-containing protein [Halobacteriales archaeon]
MVRAYIMIKANTGEADRLKNDVETLNGVESVHIVAGDVDLIATVEVDEPADVKEIATGGIQTIAGVEDTRTYIAMD